jgi:hypothetical protein
VVIYELQGLAEARGLAEVPAGTAPDA